MAGRRPNLAATGIFGSASAAVPTAANAIPATPRTTGGRAGKRACPLWLPEAAKKQLDYMVVEHDTTAQGLLTEAVNDLFKKYGKPPIA